MIFGGYFNEFQRRYHTRQQALKSHHIIVATVKLSLQMVMINNQTINRRAFKKWSKDHFQGQIFYFDELDSNYIGFTNKADAALFKLSAWYQPISD